ncbi:TPA: LuxR C-terminal-related transcriptional regulator [Elizabethkingia anophelis]
MGTVKPMPQSEFERRFKTDIPSNSDDICDYFTDIILNLKRFSMFPYFWNIMTFNDMKMKHVCNNIQDFTPLSREEWFTSDAETLRALFHPEDADYWISAAAAVNEMYLNTEPSFCDKFITSIYTRVQNKNKEYRWTSIQYFPYSVVPGKLDSALAVVYDLSHIAIANKPFISALGFDDNEVLHFKHLEQPSKELGMDIPEITKREKEILYLLIQGYNTPKIAEKLNISYHTVENHKKNLRRKTNCNTSSALVAYVINYNLLLL